MECVVQRREREALFRFEGVEVGCRVSISELLLLWQS